MNTKQSNTYSALDSVYSVRCFCAIGLIVIMLSAFLGNLRFITCVMFVGLLYMVGYLSLFCHVCFSLFFKFGAFVDVGPFFNTCERIVCNFIYCM